jgi:hypothetical protein
MNYTSAQGWITPNFRVRKSAGELIPYTPWLKEARSMSLSGEFHIQWDNTTVDYVHPVPYHQDGITAIWTDGLYLPDSFEINHYNELNDNFADAREMFASVSTDAVVQEAAARIYTEGFDALTSSAEFHKTIRLFVGFKKRILKELKRGTLYNLWLEGRYGWRILMYELLELNKAIVDFSETRTRYTEIAFSRLTTKTATEEELLTTYQLPPEIQGTWNSADMYYYFGTKTDIDISIKGSIAADIKPARFRANVFDTAWELIPYSFVVDWFIGVGTWIQAMSLEALATENVAAGGLHMKVSRTFHAERPGLINRPNLFVDPILCGLKVYGERTLDLTERTPTSISNVPQFEINLNAFKVLDLVALLISAVRKDGGFHRR